MVKHETVLPSQKDKLHPILAELEKDEFSKRNKNKRKNIINKPLDSIFFETVKPFQSQSQLLFNKNTETLLQQSAISNDSDINDFDDPIGKRHHKTMIIFLLIYR